ncbi:hypothetical protein [Candidatus Uabimicrobium sp. HlEnr_7]|uniref:hypothetical protein n=1 Tax=Candidatus Uabimicrobium helgolandensis TaxID=3095367 RepID=UPI003558DDFA
MRIIRKKSKKVASQNKGNVWGSPTSRYVGNNANKPTAKPLRPGRRTKSLTGPVHPGFEKSATAYNKRRSATKTVSAPRLTLQRVNQSQDLYSNGKPRSVRKRRTR